MKIIIAIIIAFCWGLWPIIIGKFKVPSPWGVTIATAIALITLSFMKHEVSLVSVERKLILVACVAGVLNGIGLWLYPRLFMGDDPGKYVAIATAFIPVFALFGGNVLNGTTPTTNQILGVVIIVVGIFLLQKGSQKTYS